MAASMMDAADQTPGAEETLSNAQQPNRSALAPTSTPSPTIAQQPTQNMGGLPEHDPQSWGSRVYHGVLSALGGANDVSLARDPQTGKMVATAVKSGPGQQWKRIIAGALEGYAGAAATGATGPGSTSTKIGAGFQAGFGAARQQQQQKRDQANEDFEAEQKAATSQAQNALLMHQIAKSTFDLGRAQVEAATSDLDRENTFSQVISQGGVGSEDLGVFPDFQSVIQAFKQNPELHNHQAGGRIIGIPHINEKGQVDGVHAALVSPDWLNSKINQDLPVVTRQYKDGKLEESTFTIPAGSLTGDQYSKLIMSQSKDALDAAMKDRQQQQEEERTQIQKDLALSTIEKNAAERDLANFNRGGGDAAQLVDMIGQGKMNTGRLAYIMARNPQLLGAVADKYPDFDSSRVEAYLSAYKDFTSGKTAIQLNAGATALRHMAELRAMNTNASHIPGTAAYNAYQNKADTLSTELAKFYGDATIPAIAAIKKTLTATLPKNRDAGIRTQAQSMIDKFDEFRNQWANASPSKEYEAKMPSMSDAAKQALAGFRHDFEPETEKPAANLPKEAAAQLKEGVHTTFANGQTWTLENGQPKQVNANGQ